MPSLNSHLHAYSRAQMANLLIFSRLCPRHCTLSPLYSKYLIKHHTISRHSLSTSVAAFSNASPTEPVLSAAKTLSPTINTPVPDISSSSSSASPPTELDLTQFLSSSPTETVLSLADKVGPLTAADLDLTWYLPTGVAFQIFEFLNNYFPAWGSIAVFTLCARLIILPRLIANQKFMAESSYWMPDIIRAQQKLTKAIRSGNQSEITKVLEETPDVQERQKSMMKNSILTAAVQMPIFLSAYHVLSAYSKHSIPAFTTGGFSWISDLTIPDPYIILPTYMGLSLYAIFKSGVEFGNSGTAYSNPVFTKILFIGVPSLTFGTSIWMGWPSALLLYWCFNNTFSLIQVNVLRQRAVQAYFNIPERRKFDMKEVRPEKSLKESFNEMKEGLTVARDFNAREATARAFEKAGNEPPKKTRRLDLSKIEPRR